MTSVSLDRIASALGMTNEKTPDTHIWATVSSINEDGSYQVTLNGASNTTRAARLCNASVGDRVFCVVSNGKATAIGRVGGDFPIGYIYLSYTNVSPASMFGGTWEQLTDVFLRAANDTNTGGNDSHSHWLPMGPWADDTGYFGVCVDGASQPITASRHSPYTSCRDQFERQDFRTDWCQEVRSHSETALPAYQNIYAWRRTA